MSFCLLRCKSTMTLHCDHVNAKLTKYHVDLGVCLCFCLRRHRRWPLPGRGAARGPALHHCWAASAPSSPPPQLPRAHRAPAAQPCSRASEAARKITLTPTNQHCVIKLRSIREETEKSEKSIWATDFSFFFFEKAIIWRCQSDRDDPLATNLH